MANNHVAPGGGFSVQPRQPDPLDMVALKHIYGDEGDPWAFQSVIMALAQITLCDKSKAVFHRKWIEGFNEWEMPRQEPKTGVKVQRGRGDMTFQMSSTTVGETAVVMLSFLLHAMKSTDVVKFIQKLLNKIPSSQLPFRASQDKIEGIVNAAEIQTSSVSWHEEISKAEAQLGEAHRSFNLDPEARSVLREIPIETMAGYYRYLSLVSAFPEASCELKTSHSILVPYLLARYFCELRVCVIIDDQVVRGSNLPGNYQVLLKRYTREQETTTVRFLQPIDDPQDILISEEKGPLRANRIPIKGIAKAVTVNRGMEFSEARDLAALAIVLARQILSRLERDITRNADDPFTEELHNFQLALSDHPSDKRQADVEDARQHIVPIQTQITASAVATWWDCSMEDARWLFARENEVRKVQDSNLTWSDLTFANSTMATIMKFGILPEKEKKVISRMTKTPLSSDDYENLVRTLTTQLILISFLGDGPASQGLIHVRSRHDPVNTTVGRAIENLESLRPLGVDDIMNSWYIWIKGQPPPPLFNRVDAFVSDGFLIYRSLLFDISLKPDACEAVLVEPGYMKFDGRIWKLAQSPLIDKAGTKVLGSALHQIPVKGRKGDSRRIIPEDWTLSIIPSWTVVKGEATDSLEIRLELRDLQDNARKSPLSITTSIYEIARRSWTLRHADHDGDNHESHEPALIFPGQFCLELSAGCREEQYKPGKSLSIVFYKAYGNDLGRVACLMSTESFGGYGLVKGGKCLNCCLLEAGEKNLHFIME